MHNTFRDLLLTTHFNYFRNLINEINDLKAEFRKQRRRVKPDIGVVIGYRYIKDIATPLNRIFRFTRYSRETSVNMYCDALKKIHLLIQKLREFDYCCRELIRTFQHLYDRLFVLLPKNTIIQPPLFDTEDYRSKKPSATTGFLDWLRNYQLSGCIRRHIERQRTVKPLDIVQPSLPLSL